MPVDQQEAVIAATEKLAAARERRIAAEGRVADLQAQLAIGGLAAMEAQVHLGDARHAVSVATVEERRAMHERDEVREDTRAKTAAKLSTDHRKLVSALARALIAARPKMDALVAHEMMMQDTVGPSEGLAVNRFSPAWNAIASSTPMCESLLDHWMRHAAEVGLLDENVIST